MYSFLYCYVVPFLTGLAVGLGLVIIAIVILGAIGLVCQAVEYLMDRDIPYKVIKWGKRIVVALVALIISAFVAWMFWQMGIDILQRFECL